MSNELDTIFGGSRDRRPVRPGERRERRDLERRTATAMSEAVSDANIKVIKAELRKRFTEKTMYDVSDVMGLFTQLAGGDPTVAAALAPIVQEYVRGSARDIRNFDGLFGGM